MILDSNQLLSANVRSPKPLRAIVAFPPLGPVWTIIFFVCFLPLSTSSWLRCELPARESLVLFPTSRSSQSREPESLIFATRFRLSCRRRNPPVTQAVLSGPFDCYCCFRTSAARRLC